MLYSIVKWIHILCAIVSLGANLTYFPWFIRVPKNRETLVFTISTIRILDNWIANPSYVLAYITGEIMMRVGGYIHYSTPWMTVALIFVCCDLGARSIRLRVVAQETTDTGGNRRSRRRQLPTRFPQRNYPRNGHRYFYAWNHLPDGEQTAVVVTRRLKLDYVSFYSDSWSGYRWYFLPSVFNRQNQNRVS